MIQKETMKKKKGGERGEGRYAVQFFNFKKLLYLVKKLY